MPRVLIVEDEPAAARYLRSMIELKCPEFSVVGISGNGKEALDEIRRSKPELVLTDARMPVMDGLEFVAKLLWHRPSRRSRGSVPSGCRPFWRPAIARPPRSELR
ncbi:MAG: response regulator [Rectinemataceae bacterium]